MVTCTYETVIHAGSEQVGDYLGQVLNLPNWTKFFVHIGECVDGKYTVQTVMGQIQTWIEQHPYDQGSRYTICSIIRGALEQARLELTPHEQGTHIRFIVELPDGAPEERIARQNEILKQELLQLKALIEVPETISSSAQI